MATAANTETKRPCAHGDLWRARDGLWYCVACSPPHFPGEVVARRQEHELLELFPERTSWEELGPTWGEAA